MHCGCELVKNPATCGVLHLLSAPSGCPTRSSMGATSARTTIDRGSDMGIFSMVSTYRSSFEARTWGGPGVSSHVDKVHWRAYDEPSSAFCDV
jgi:hypothetical protein